MSKIRKLFSNKPVIIIYLISMLILTTITIISFRIIILPSMENKFSERTYKDNNTSALTTTRFIEETINSNSNILEGIESTFHHIDDISSIDLDSYFYDLSLAAFFV